MATQGKAAYEKKFKQVREAGGSRAAARAQALTERRHARRHFSGGKGKGTWHRMTGGHGLRRVRLHKFYDPSGSGRWTRTPHSIYRTHQYSRPTKRKKPYGKKLPPKTMAKGTVNPGTVNPGSMSIRQRRLQRDAALARDAARRRRHNLPMREYSGGSAFTPGQPRTLQIEHPWTNDRPGSATDRYWRAQTRAPAPVGRDERRYGNLERNAALRTRLGLTGPRLTYEEAGWYL